MPLHTDHRPQTLDDLFGNESLKASLKAVLTAKDRPSSYLFTGPSGCGKTTLARIVARQVGCNMDQDYQELDIGDARGIDDARRIKQHLHFAPMGGKVKVYCLDECHKANDFFQDAMLKALEEPPRHVVFILCTTDPGKLKQTVKRRCHQLEVKPLSDPEMAAFISHSLGREGIDGYPPEVTAELVQAAGGSPGMALNLLGQVIDMGDMGQAIEVIRRTVVTEASVIDLCRALLTQDMRGCVAQLRLMPEKMETEPVRRAILKYMRKVLLGNRPNQQAMAVMRAFEQPFFDGGLDGLVARVCSVVRWN